MADNLLPNDQLTKEQQRKMFSVIFSMIFISANFLSTKNFNRKCVDNWTLNKKEVNISTDNIYKGDLNNLAT